jgi:hypothetical protein
MKLQFITKLTCLLILTLFSVVFSVKSRSNCSISSISIAPGTGRPIIVYNTDISINNVEENVRLTVVGKEVSENYRVNSELIEDDKITGDKWFSNKKLKENKVEMKDAFNLCKTIHKDNMQNKLWEDKSNLNYRIDTLPENLELKEQKTTSFLMVTNEEEPGKDDETYDLSALELDDKNELEEDSDKNNA